MGREALSQQFTVLHTDSKRRPAARVAWWWALGSAWVRMYTGRGGRERDQIGSWPSHGQHPMSQATVTESAENDSGTDFSKCWLFPMER